MLHAQRINIPMNNVPRVQVPQSLQQLSKKALDCHTLLSDKPSLSLHSPSYLVLTQISRPLHPSTSQYPTIHA